MADFGTTEHRTAFSGNAVCGRAGVDACAGQSSLDMERTLSGGPCAWHARGGDSGRKPWRPGGASSTPACPRARSLTPSRTPSGGASPKRDLNEGGQVSGELRSRVQCWRRPAAPQSLAIQEVNGRWRVRNQAERMPREPDNEATPSSSRSAPAVSKQDSVDTVKTDKTRLPGANAGRAGFAQNTQASAQSIAALKQDKVILQKALAESEARRHCEDSAAKKTIAEMTKEVDQLRAALKDFSDSKEQEIADAWAAADAAEARYLETLAALRAVSGHAPAEGLVSTALIPTPVLQFSSKQNAAAGAEKISTDAVAVRRPGDKLLRGPPTFPGLLTKAGDKVQKPSLHRKAEAKPQRRQTRALRGENE